MSNFRIGEWEARLYDVPGMMAIDLWLRRTRGSLQEVLTHEGIAKEVKQDEMSDPNDYFVRFESLDQLHAIAEALANYGVKTSNDHKNEGLLEATKYHLEDMRRIAFEPHIEVSQQLPQRLPQIEVDDAVA